MSRSTSPIRLTEWTTCGGCAAKWGAARLRELVGAIGGPTSPAGLLVGLDPSDDAAVYQVSDDVALVSTTDFFPPLVDDPSDFGAIAAANACSDVFAMGGKVVLALHIAAFPEEFPLDAMGEIFAAAAATVVEAGGVVAGGHTIRSTEPIFGLAVQGVVQPGRQLTKGGARIGDVLVLSKPLGTGLVLAAAPGDPTGTHLAEAISGMRELNRSAAEALVACGAAVHAATDVTGFGLAGHGWEMAERSDARLSFEVAALPTYRGARAAAAAGVRTGGHARNAEAVVGRMVAHGSTDEAAVAEALALDPQTSGGLLAAVDPAILDDLLAVGFVAVGTVVNGPPGLDLR